MRLDLRNALFPTLWRFGAGDGTHLVGGGDGR